MSPHLLHPELLLVLVPAVWVWWRAQPRRVLPLVVVILLGLVLATPVGRWESAGVDLIVVVDRSRSMPRDALSTVDEVLRLAIDQRSENDRVGVVSFGRRAAVELLPSRERRDVKFARAFDDEASDLASGIGLALQLVPNDRAGRVLILSDGKATGPDPMRIAADAAARGIPTDFRRLARPGLRDVAVDRLELPLEIMPGEAFQLSGWVSATDPGPARYELLRGAKVVASGEVELRSGPNRLFFRDRLALPGVATYTLRVLAGEDRVPQNNTGRGVLRVAGGRAVLALSHDGRAGNLGRALASTGRPVHVRAASATPISLSFLDRYRVVVLENVATTDFNEAALETFRRYVEDLGGGLLITGGRRSFGLGGYHASKLDPVLPVSMKMREEQRKSRIAEAFVLDRSGSMSAPASGSRTKMDLANQGVAAAVRLLSDLDEVAVVAVDSAPHVVQELTPASRRDEIARKVLQIESMGGGIFTYTGLVAGGEQLARSDLATKHILLFADAADAEQPEGCVELLRRFREADITVSVVALGTEGDRDAAFLKGVAERGGGQVWFTERAESLPRLFSLDTITVARSSWSDGDVSMDVVPDVKQLGDLKTGIATAVGGYNITHLKEGAVLGARTTDADAAPLLSSWHRGLGRVVAFCAEADGRHTGKLAKWSEYAPFFAAMCEWCAGAEAPLAYAASARREGHRVTVTLDLDPEDRSAWPRGAPTLVVIPDHADEPVQRIPLAWESATRLQAGYDIETGATRHHRVEVDGKVLSANPVTLPYSPEYEPQRGVGGARLLGRISARTGGRERAHMDGLFEGVRPSRRLIDLSPWLLAAALSLLVIDVVARRLGIGRPDVRGGLKLRRTRTAPEPEVSKPSSPESAATDDASVRVGKGTLESLREARERARRRLGD